MHYRTARESRLAGIAYHLVPVEVWRSQKESGRYLPEAFEEDGFVHLTNGLDLLTTVANSLYVSDARPHTVLVIDIARITSDVRYDDRDQHFPHVYGPLDRDAVIGELEVERDPDGRFVRLGQAGLSDR